MEYVNRDKEGLFNWHVGYAPQMKSDEPEKVEEDGYGEMGRIMREFMINEARAQRGLSILDTPGYALKLWDDDADNDGESDGFFGAPSIKDLTNVAVSVVAYSAGVGPLLTAAINLADDALFTALDVGTGYRDAGDAWGSFGVQAASAVASSSIGGAFNGFVGADTAAKAVTDGSQSFWTHGMNGLIDRSMADATGFFGSSFVSTSIDIGMNATQSIATNAASSAISSYDFSNWEFDDKKIYESTFGKSAWAGYAGSAASTAFTAGLNWSVDGTLGRDLAQVRSLNQLAGSAVNAGIQYRMTGSTTLNVLSASDLSGGSLRGGLLELHLGEGGTGMNLGSGGIGMSAVQVANSIGGLKTYGRNVRIAANGYWGKEAVAARMLATSGLTETEDLFDQLMNGEAELAYGGTDGRAETRVANGLKTIYLGDGASAGSRYQLGLTLSHEAFRNGLDDGNAGQQLETVNAVIGHSRVAQLVAGAYGEDNLSETQRGEVALLEYAQGTGDISALAGHAIGAYDSGADYWRMTADGEILFYKSRNLYDENGELLREYEGSGDGGYAASLAEHLGISRDAANQMMRDAGWTYSEGTFTTDGGTTDVVNNANRTLDPGARFSARYFVQRDYIDNVGEYGGSMVAAIGAAQETAETAFMRALQGGDLTPDIAAQYEAASAMGAFAQRYDATLYGERNGSFGVPGLLDAGAAAAYDGSSVSAALQEVAQDRSRTDDHPMYQHILDGTFAPLLRQDGSVGPTVGADRASGRRDGDETYITARSRYNSGEPHGWFRNPYHAISVDLGTRRQPLETVLFADSTLLAQGAPFGWTDSSGGFAQLDAGPVDLRYVHLARSWEQQRSRALHQAAMEANLFRYSLPAGYSLGPLFDGAMPGSTGTHLHLEFIYR